jgi:Fe-S-cluster containining protein
VDIHFGCTQCGVCCNKLKIPLTAAEAMAWLDAGHEVQIVCEATPWAMDFPPDDLKAAHRKRRSFPAASGSVATRVVAILAANNAGACPNLLPDLRCGIYERRPLVCRIYPAEINPFIALEPAKKACPAEAWTADRPLLARNGVVADPELQRTILESRDTDARETGIKREVCSILNLAAAALAEEGFVVHSPPADALRDALARAMRSAGGAAPLNQWRFISNRADTVDQLLQSGAVAVLASSDEPMPFQYLGFKPGSPGP